jgi:hypothetical protein
MLALKNQCSLDEKHPVLRVGDAEGARNAHAVRFKRAEPIIAISRGPFRANSGGEKLPRVNPGLRSLGHFGPRIGGMTDEARILRRDLL